MRRNLNINNLGDWWRTLSYGKTMYERTSRIAEVVEKQCCNSNLGAKYSCHNFASGTTLRLNFRPSMSSFHASTRRLRPVFTLHAVDGEGMFSSDAYFNSRYFSTLETIDSVLKIQAGFFKFLSESTVVGYAKESIIFIHESTGLPWWGSIMLTTVILRTCVILPFTIYQNYILAKVENLTLEMPQIAKQLGMETTYAIKKLNWTEAQAKVAYRRSLKKQWNKLILRDNCHPFKAGVVLWVQISVWIIYSTALRNIVYMLPDKDVAAAMLNLELSVGGTLWFPNLTMVDSSLILPVTFGLVNLIIIELQERSRVKKTTKFQKYVTNFFRGLSVVMVPIAAGVPSCLCLYWVTSSVTGLAHNLMMLSPRVRRLSGIPATPSERAQPYTHLRRELQEALTFKKNVRKQ